jgi:DNA-binding MarR family transcriptional regulator
MPAHHAISIRSIGLFRGQSAARPAAKPDPAKALDMVLSPLLACRPQQAAPFVSWYDIHVRAPRDLTRDQYRELAEFRRQIRRFLHFSETTAKEHGVEPQQHQLLLAVHGLPDGVKPTIGEIASRLFIRHHSAVELVNRLEHTGAIARRPGADDKREVWIRLTPAGRATLRKLALAHRTELERTGPELAATLKSILQ